MVIRQVVILNYRIRDFIFILFYLPGGELIHRGERERWREGRPRPTVDTTIIFIKFARPGAVLLLWSYAGRAEDNTDNRKTN